MSTSLVDTLYGAAKWMLDLGRVHKALDLFRAMVLTAPGDERSWLGLGACHERLGQEAIALELYRMGAETARSARCHVARSRVLRRLGRDLDAAVALDSAETLAVDAESEELVTHERRAA